ncbi:molybdate ABC transporter substrate-binding protein [Agromyces sp. SYSU T0242]|uniref:molybdate ABC transporter substrate-binding protein n=1 Tax=Agromyces litoreus TaxID=3158561 RepID=UPI0033981FA2
MPRRAAAAVLATAIAVLPTGCATTERDAPDAADATARVEGTITVFAAASLAEAFEELAHRFERAHPGSHVDLNLAGSTALAQQVLAGAPADVLATADDASMELVVAAGLADAPVGFASNTLELVVPADSPAAVTGLDDLARDELRIALCDPTVPCGAAAVRLLRAAGVDAAPDTLESDVRAVLTKVVLGEADAGLVYRTDARAAGDRVTGIPVPGASSVVNRYPIAVTTEATHPQVAEAFVAFATGPEARRVLDGLGFGAP